MPTPRQDYFALFQDFFQTIKRLRAPLILGTLSLLALSIPGQVLELYVILARDWWGLLPQILFALLSLTCLSLFIAHVSRVLTRPDADDANPGSVQLAQHRLTRSIPLMLGLLPLLGCAIGLFRALQSASTEILLRTANTIAAFQDGTRVLEAYKAWQRHSGGDQQISETLPERVKWLLDSAVPNALLDLQDKNKQLAIATSIGVAVCIAICFVLLAVSARARTSSSGKPGECKLFHPLTIFLVTATFGATTALFAAQLVDSHYFLFTGVPRTLGALTLLNLNLLFLVFFCSLLTRFSDRIKIPLISIVIVLALAFSFFNWNDNHGARLIPAHVASRVQPCGVANNTAGLISAKDGSEERCGVAEAFDAWFKNRPEVYKRKFENKPYPIYVVAAQGNGIYAANLVGLALARIYDRCPAIRHHLFAVSGVSGGSVGAGYLAALLNDPATAPHDDTCVLDASKGPIETKMEKLLQADLLSPVVAGMLFPDLLQRLIPYPFETLDRARAFEAGVETAWDNSVSAQHNPLREPFRKHWRADGAAPMLFLNTTVVETGHQVAFAPVMIEAQIPALETLQKELARPGFDVPLSTAMSLSARSPLVMPAGRLPLSRWDIRVADGAYFENSGVEAALDIVEQLRPHLCGVDPIDYSSCQAKGKDQTYAFRLVVLTDYSPADVLDDPNAVVGGLNEILAPVQAMYNSRTARGQLIVGRLKQFVPIATEAQRRFMVPTVLISLNPNLYHLPMGWQLSKQAQSVIAAQIGDPAQCRQGAGTPGYGRGAQFASYVDAGIQLLNGHEGRINRTPFVRMLETLRSNQCGMFDVFGADGVGPRKPRCLDIHKAEMRGIRALGQAQKKWAAEVEQRHGRIFADLEYAEGVIGSCQQTGQGISECWVEATPCEKLGG